MKSDGDRFTVVWDSDIVPKVLAQVCVKMIVQRATAYPALKSYDYPAPKAPVNLNITRKQLATHFANYNK